MFSNMAASFIRTVRIDEESKEKPKVPGRIVTTLPKAKELRPFIEKLVTLARHARVHELAAAPFATAAKRNTPEWKAWRESETYRKWNQAIAPAVRARRKAFSVLRDKLAVQILFHELAERFEFREGGYTRVLRLASFRLGDAGQQAIIEFVGVHDRAKKRRSRPASIPVVAPTAPAGSAEAPAAPQPAAAEGTSEG
ncbi:MAG: bL17 family ribosomal protein [Planctomycetales bacterium]